MASDRTPAVRPEEGFRLAAWEVHPQLNRLVSEHGTVQLEPRHMDLLVELARRPGAVRAKHELIDAVWPQEHVAESVLTRAIGELRRAMGDDARAPRYVETIARRGYRLVCAVEPLAGEAVGPIVPRKGLPRWVGPVGFALLLLVTGVLGTMLVLGGPDTADGGGEEHVVVNLRQLTSAQGVEAFPDFDPTGRAIAFTSDRSGRFEIWVRQLTSGGSDVQVTDDGLFNVQPTWSPDGSRIAYHSVIAGGIWTVPAFGGPPRQAAPFGCDPAWSPDGEWLVFRSDSLRSFSSSDVLSAPGSTLWRVEVDGGDPVQLTRRGDPPGGHFLATFAPDGESVIFANGFNDAAAVWRVGLDGGRPRLIAEIDVVDLAVRPGGASALGLAFRGGESWLVELPLDRTRGEVTERRLARLDGGHLALSADGRRLVFSRFLAASRLWTLPVDGVRPAGPTRELTDGTTVRDLAPSVSPDGRHVAFLRWSYGEGRVAMLLDLATGDQQRLPAVISPSSHLSWSEDGRQLRFMADRRWCGYELVTRRVESITGIARLPDSLAFGLSPDGRRMCFNRTVDGRTNVWISRPDGSGARQLTFHESFAGWAAWSPDGTRLVYQVGEPPEQDLAVVSVEGGAPRVFDVGPGLSWGARWAPDGEHLVFAARRDGVWNLHVVHTATLRESALTTYTDQSSYVRWPAWSPRGFIVYERSQVSSNLWVAELAHAAPDGN